MWAYQMAGRGGGVRESAVKWSGKNEFGQGKVSEKSGNFISDLEWAPCCVCQLVSTLFW